MRLWLYLTLIVNTIIFLAFLRIGVQGAENQVEFRLQETQRDSRYIAQSLAAGAANDLLAANLDNLEHLLLRSASIIPMQEMLIADAQGMVVVRVLRNAKGEFKVIYEKAQPRIAIERKEKLTEDSYTLLAAIERGQVIGWVRIVADLGNLRELRRNIWIETLGASLLTALFVGIVLLLILRRVSRNLENAAGFAANLKLQRGNILPVASPIIEIRQLQSALNDASFELAREFRKLQDAEARKSAILEASLDSLVTIDSEGKVIDFNPAAEQTFGYRHDEAIGRKMCELIVPPAYRVSHEQGMRRYLDTGEGPVLRKRIEIVAQRRDGSEFPIELSIVPFEGSGKRLFLGSIRDISEQKALEAEQKRISTLLHQTVSDLQVRQLALDEHAVVGVTDLAGNITYANQKFCDISGYIREELLGNNYRLLKSGLQGESYYRQMWLTITAGQVWHGELANRRKDGDLYWIAYTIVPMLDDAGQPGGFISIGTNITEQKNAEQALAEAHRRELETGNEIQRSLLLGDVPESIHGAHLATYTEPSQGIDGDFFAITRFRPDCFELLVGDVMGKGVPAALIGAGVKSRYHQALTELLAQRTGNAAPSPADIVNALHRAVTRRLIELDTFVTLALYRFDISAGTLTLVNAGHTPALLVRDNDTHVEVVHGDNLPLGVIEGETYSQKTLDIRQGDALLVYSDGITEACNIKREEFGLDRLSSILRAGRAAFLPPSAQLQSIRQEVRRFVGSDILRDDQTAAMVELQPRRMGMRATIAQRKAPSVLVLPWRLDGLDSLRRVLPQVASRLGEDEQQAVLLASFEAATNILRHSRPYFDDATIACRMTQHDEEFSVELIYPGPCFNPPNNPQPDFSGDSEGGFGLYIINNSVDSVEYLALAPGISSIRLFKRAVRGQSA